MSDDYGNDNDYWDDMYYYENYDKEMDPNSWPGGGHSRSSSSSGFWIWLVIYILACNISSGLGDVVLVIGLILWIISKLGK